MHQGAKYMEENFPQTDRFRSCRVERRTTKLPENDHSNALENDTKLRHHAVPYNDQNPTTNSVIMNPFSAVLVLLLGSMVAIGAQTRRRKQRKASEKQSA
jgi:hypothetical protein